MEWKATAAVFMVSIAKLNIQYSSVISSQLSGDLPIKKIGDVNDINIMAR